MARRLLLLVALAALLPACHKNNSVTSTVGASQLSLSVAPNPVVTVQSSLVGPTFSIKFTTTVKESAGLGASIDSITANLFDDTTGALLGQTTFDDKDLVVFVGSKRVEASGTLAIEQEISYIAVASHPGSLTVTVHAKDDKGNSFEIAILVKVS